MRTLIPELLRPVGEEFVIAKPLARLAISKSVFVDHVSFGLRKSAPERGGNFREQRRV